MNTIKRWFSALALRLGRARLRRQLLALDDRQLSDQGLSRELLRAGVDAWPWRYVCTHRPTQDSALPNDLLDEAMRALDKLTDGELDDLGLTRGNVQDALKFRLAASTLSQERRVA